MAIIIKHMAGNMRSRFTDFLTTDGEKPDRNRDQEFIVAADATRAEILAVWEQDWQLVFETLNGIGPGDLERTVAIRGEPHSVLQAINRQVAHYAYHVGTNRFSRQALEGRRVEDVERPQGPERTVQREDAEETKHQVEGAAWFDFVR